MRQRQSTQKKQTNPWRKRCPECNSTMKVRVIGMQISDPNLDEEKKDREHEILARRNPNVNGIMYVCSGERCTHCE